MTIRFCIETGKGKYVPIEFTQGEEDEFFDRIFNKYKINTFTPESRLETIEDTTSFSYTYTAECEDGYCYKNYNKIIELEEHNEEFVLYNNKIYIKQLYNMSVLDIKYRLIFCMKMDLLNDDDRKNNGIIIDGKFINAEKYYNKYREMKEIIDGDSNHHVVWSVGKNRVRACMTADECIEFILDIGM